MGAEICLSRGDIEHLLNSEHLIPQQIEELGRWADLKASVQPFLSLYEGLYVGFISHNSSNFMPLYLVC